jgi:hypothetical protein
MRFRLIHTVRKVSIPEFLYCRMLWVPHPPSRAKWVPPLCFSTSCVYSRLHLFAGEGGGWPQIIRQQRKSGTLYTPTEKRTDEMQRRHSDSPLL